MKKALIGPMWTWVVLGLCMITSQAGCDDELREAQEMCLHYCLAVHDDEYRRLVLAEENQGSSLPSDTARNGDKFIKLEVEFWEGILEQNIRQFELMDVCFHRGDNVSDEASGGTCGEVTFSHCRHECEDSYQTRKVELDVEKTIKLLQKMGSTKAQQLDKRIDAIAARLGTSFGLEEE